MTTIYLVRHAEAEGNLCRRIHGHFDTNITPNGMRQIADLKHRFENVHIDACYSSDLTRTKTTAQAIYVPKGLRLQTNPAFREVYLGVWEDIPFGYLYTREAEAINAFCNDPKQWHVENSETFEAYTARFLRAMDEVVQRHPNESIAIVSHGAVLRGVLLALFPELEIRHADNTAVTCLTWENGTYHLEYLNDNSHLQTGESLFAKQTWWKQKNAGNDGTLWFWDGLLPMEGLTPKTAEYTYTAMMGELPIGYVSVRTEKDCGIVEDMALLPAYRGRGFAIQLLGQAMFTVRAMGKAELRIQVPADHDAMKALCKKLFFRETGHGQLVLNLKVRVIPME